MLRRGDCGREVARWSWGSAGWWVGGLGTRCDAPVLVELWRTPLPTIQTHTDASKQQHSETEGQAARGRTRRLRLPGSVLGAAHTPSTIRNNNTTLNELEASSSLVDQTCNSAFLLSARPRIYPRYLLLQCTYSERGGRASGSGSRIDKPRRPPHLLFIDLRAARSHSITSSSWPHPRCLEFLALQPIPRWRPHTGPGTPASPRTSFRSTSTISRASHTTSRPLAAPPDPSTASAPLPGILWAVSLQQAPRTRRCVFVSSPAGVAGSHRSWPLGPVRLTSKLVGNPEKPNVRFSTELKGHLVGIEKIAFNPVKDAELCSVSNDGIVKFWDVRTKTCVNEVKGLGNAHTLAWAPDGSSLLVGNRVGSLAEARGPGHNSLLTSTSRAL